MSATLSPVIATCIHLCDLPLATFSVVSEKSVGCGARGLRVFSISLLFSPLTVREDDRPVVVGRFAVNWKLALGLADSCVLQKKKSINWKHRSSRGNYSVVCVDSMSVHFHCRSGPVGSCDLK